MVTDWEELRAVRAEFADGDRLTAFELANYLYYLKTLYAYIYDQSDRFRDELDLPFRKANSDVGVRQLARLAESVTSEIEQKDWRWFSKYNYFRRDLFGDDLEIKEVTRHSPLEIGFVALVGVLVLALVISGGELTISQKELRVKLPPIGEGLELLKRLFK